MNKKLENNPKFAEVFTLLNSNNVSNSQLEASLNNVIAYSKGLTKSTSSINRSNNDCNIREFLNKPVNIPSLKQRLNSNSQKKINYKLFDKANSKFNTKTQNQILITESFVKTCKSKSVLSYKSDENKGSSGVINPNSNNSCNKDKGAVSYSTMSFNYSDKEAKINFSDKKAYSNSLSNAKLYEKQSNSSSQTDQICNVKREDSGINQNQTDRKAFNLKSKSLIKKKNFYKNQYDVGGNIDIIHESINDIEAAIKKQETNLSRPASQRKDGDKFYCINVYLNKK